MLPRRNYFVLVAKALPYLFGYVMENFFVMHRIDWPEWLKRMPDWAINKILQTPQPGAEFRKDK